MNPYNNHLVADLTAVDEALRPDYIPIPKHLFEEAKQVLGDQESVYVHSNVSESLAAWAAKKRTKSRTRAKLAKKARKASRKK